MRVLTGAADRTKAATRTFTGIVFFGVTRHTLGHVHGAFAADVLRAPGLDRHGPQLHGNSKRIQSQYQDYGPVRAGTFR